MKPPAGGYSWRNRHRSRRLPGPPFAGVVKNPAQHVFTETEQELLGLQPARHRQLGAAQGGAEALGEYHAQGPVRLFGDRDIPTSSRRID